MPTKASNPHGQILPPIDMDVPPPPRMDGVEVRRCHPICYRDAVRLAHVLHMLPIVQAEMRERVSGWQKEKTK